MPVDRWRGTLGASTIELGLFVSALLVVSLMVFDMYTQSVHEGASAAYMMAPTEASLDDIQQQIEEREAQRLKADGRENNPNAVNPKLAGTSL